MSGVCIPFGNSRRYLIERDWEKRIRMDIGGPCDLMQTAGWAWLVLFTNAVMIGDGIDLVQNNWEDF